MNKSKTAENKSGKKQKLICYKRAEWWITLYYELLIHKTTKNYLIPKRYFGFVAAVKFILIRSILQYIRFNVSLHSCCRYFLLFVPEFGFCKKKKGVGLISKGDNTSKSLQCNRSLQIGIWCLLWWFLSLLMFNFFQFLCVVFLILAPFTFVVSKDVQSIFLCI